MVLRQELQDHVSQAKIEAQLYETKVRLCCVEVGNGALCSHHSGQLCIVIVVLSGCSQRRAVNARVAEFAVFSSNHRVIYSHSHPFAIGVCVLCPANLQIEGLHGEIRDLNSKLAAIERDNEELVRASRTTTTKSQDVEYRKQCLELEINKVKGVVAMQDTRLKV